MTSQWGSSPCQSATSSNAKCPFQHLYHFGDGFTDIGNSIHLGNSNPAARLPYGITTPAVDFGLPHITPYLSMNASKDYDGIVFSVARSPVLELRFFESRGVKFPSFATPLRTQLNWFRDYLNSTCSTQTDCATRLENALLLLGHIDGNDIGYPLAQGKSIEEVRTYVHPVIRETINAARELIGLGAKLIIIPGNAPLGCYPYILTSVISNDPTSYDDLGCLRNVNDLIQSKNKDLQQAIIELGREFPNVTINFGEIFSGPNGDLALKSCCGIGGNYNYDPTENKFCGRPGVPVCPYPDQYVFWDGLHFANLAYARIETLLIAPALVTLNCTSNSSALMSPITDTVATM
ncbi:hypothetical protein BUALT_Bualt13G0066600 [Buddleja alternifolia]|uniref:Uncharacterized protein n=1 Tax=Buddleja alternifolia TaxID=168488 RepID=A0AAV6WWB8_9LAMI|nr:hypothetical protein BUALT_Bualt13G0066600 [Buddleja alternifolia]